ncbi:MAG: UPF0280 family protein [Planctomycetota bacterium]
MPESRTYPRLVLCEDLETFEIRVDDIELQIAATRDLSGAAISAIHQIRGILARFCETHPDFATTLDPYPTLHREWPHEVQSMIRAGRAAGVGPMAAAGSCIAEYVGKTLLGSSKQVIVEDRGDVFLASTVERTYRIFAGENDLSLQMGLKIPPEITPVGICISSGTMGNALSFGMADAAIVIAHNTELADTVATGMGNRVAKKSDINAALDWAMHIQGILGAILIVDNHLSLRGEAVEMVEL